MTILLTGANGFVGSCIQELYECVPLNVDLRSSDEVVDVVKDTKPNQVIHLAAQSFVPRSFENPKETFDINFVGTFNLLAALKKSQFQGTMLFVGSGDMYGLVSEKYLPIIESTPLRPRNPYSVSKVAAEALCFQWSQVENFNIIMARAFNHIGFGQSERFALSDFAKQIVEIKLGVRSPVIDVGDIDVTRDFTDVRDVVKAYMMLVNKGANGEVYNVCSNKEVSIRTLLEKMLEISGINASIRQKNDRYRPAEQRRVCGSNQKINQALGWCPEYDIDASLSQIINYWEGILR